MSALFFADADLAASLTEWLPTQRWYSAKNRTVAAVSIVLRQQLIDEDGFAAEHVIIDVDSVGGERQRYQVPLSYRIHPPEGFASKPLPRRNEHDPVVFDGLHDPEVAARYLHALAAGETVGSMRFQLLPGVLLESHPHPRVLSAEQSNTSVAFGERLLLKVFRLVDVGVNPDVELHRALARAGCEHVAPLLGWIETAFGSESATSAMAQEFVANAADGWSMALTSIRDLVAEADLHAHEVGGDFASEAERLGIAVAHVHADLAAVLGTETVQLDEAIIGPMRERLTAAAKIVPAIADHRSGALAVYDKAAAVGAATVQRVHGDLHLGQTLRSTTKWLLIDFEGEPVKAIAERRLPDNTLRDVAGMLRSFDYAGHHLLNDTSRSDFAQRQFRATEWTNRNCAAFCNGYASVSGADPRDQTALLHAYELDKAIYEAVYETRHRPRWLPIPMAAIIRLTRR